MRLPAIFIPSPAAAFTVCIALVCSVLFTPGCGGRPQPTAREITPLLARWFVQQDSSLYTQLRAQSVSVATLDSALGMLTRSTADTGHHDTILTDNQGGRYTMGYHIPEGLKPEGSYPLIIYLHGGVGTSRTDKGRHAYRMLAGLGDSCRLLLASPSANRATPWWHPCGLFRIAQTVRYMSLYYPVDHKKIFLAGVSDGGTACYAAANTIGAPFAGFMAISGFGPMLSRLGIRLFPSNLAQKKIYTVHAGNDRLYPIKPVKNFVRRLRDNGVNISLSAHPGKPHGFSYKEEEYDSLLHMVRTCSLPHYPGFSHYFSKGLPFLHHRILSAHFTLPSASRTPASIRGYWNNDTLMLTQSGLSRVWLSLDADRCSNHFLFFSINGSSPIKKKVHSATAAYQLMQMNARALPRCDTTQKHCRIYFTTHRR